MRLNVYLTSWNDENNINRQSIISTIVEERDCAIFRAQGMSQSNCKGGADQPMH